MFKSIRIAAIRSYYYKGGTAFPLQDTLLRFTEWHGSCCGAMPAKLARNLNLQETLPAGCQGRLFM